MSRASRHERRSRRGRVAREEAPPASQRAWPFSSLEERAGHCLGFVWANLSFLSRFYLKERAAAQTGGHIFPTVHLENRTLVLRTEREMPGAGQTRGKVK